jgi:hypothetical protein
MTSYADEAVEFASYRGFRYVVGVISIHVKGIRGEEVSLFSARQEMISARGEGRGSLFGGLARTLLRVARTLAIISHFILRAKAQCL